MARLIPNENTWVGFSTTAPASLSAPTATEIGAATNLTGFVTSINASAQGNTVPTPNLATLFETNVPGTIQATFTADFYRDDETDTAWNALARGTSGYFYISRLGGSGGSNKPAAGEPVEVWPVRIVSRTAGALSSNTVQTFTVTASVPVEPVENAIVGSATAVPSAPLNLVGSKEANGVAVLDWDVPSFVGTGFTGYTISQSSTQGGTYNNLTVGANLTITGTTARVSGLTTTQTYWFKVVATNAAGSSVAAGPVSVTV